MEKDFIFLNKGLIIKGGAGSGGSREGAGRPRGSGGKESVSIKVRGKTKSFGERVVDDPDGARKIFEEKGVSKEESKKLANSLEKYCGSETTEGNIKSNKNLDRAIEVLPQYDGVIYRGMAFEDVKTFEKFKNSKGEVISMKGVSSWSADKNQADGFTEQLEHGVLIKTRAPKLSAPIARFSGYPQEKEVLCHSRCKWKVDKVEVKNENKTVVLYVTPVERK